MKQVFSAHQFCEQDGPLGPYIESYDAEMRGEGYARHTRELQTRLVADFDLGRSASGSVDRPRFDRLVASVCAGDVGAVLCFDASRLSRNGRDWHHLLQLCGLVQARVIDVEGVYDPCRPNDRLLLGMKGSISEFELFVIRSRMLDAKHGKAQRGELRISVPIGYIWHREIGLGFDPDLRVQEAIRVIFARFRQHSKVYDRRNVEEARRDLAAWLAEWTKRYPKLCVWVEEDVEETLSFYRLPRQHHKNLKSTNMLERIMEEIKRRTLVVRIFPNAAGCLRLVRALAVELHENWIEAIRYLNMEPLQEQNKDLRRQIEDAA